MNKKNKKQFNFRLYDETIKQLNFLSETLNRDKTDVIEMAVDYLCDIHRKTVKRATPHGRSINEFDWLLQRISGQGE